MHEPGSFWARSTASFFYNALLSKHLAEFASASDVKAYRLTATNSTGMWRYPVVPDDLSNKLRPTSICSDSRVRVAYRDSRPMSAWAFFTVSRA